jgi:hypothetical protein
LVRDRLVELGVEHVRDGTYRAGIRLNDVVPRYNELARLGDPLGRWGSGTIDEHLAWVKDNVAGFAESLEGPNEYDYVESYWAANLRAYQCEWARKIRGDEVLSSKTVIGPSPHVGKGFGAALGDLSDCMDRGNLHPYPGALSPDRTGYGDLSLLLDYARSTSGTKPLWITESGYHNAVNAPVGGHVPASEKAAGVYVPRMFMENFRRGIERTYSYELIDQWPDPEKDEPEKNFGLLRNDGSPKPSFVGLGNLLTILADSGSASGKLSYSLNCDGCPAPLRQVLLRKSTGAYYLVVWPESSVWSLAARKDITNNPQYADLKLSAPGKLEVFDPSQSTTPIDTTTSASYRIALSDRLTILKITPPTPQPAPANPGF